MSRLSRRGSTIEVQSDSTQSLALGHEAERKMANGGTRRRGWWRWWSLGATINFILRVIGFSILILGVIGSVSKILAFLVHSG